jgi:hypothetical protein
MTHAEIKILPLFGKTLDSRDEAIRLFAHLKEYCTICENLELDFSEVDFMSRSFADQFHKEKLEWIKNNNLVIKIKNVSTQIMEILQAVSKTQKSKIYCKADVSVYYYSESDSLFAFLNAI